MSPSFSKIELKDLLIPWERCLGVEPGRVDPSAGAEIDENDYDFAPVFQSLESKEEVAGLVSREHLQELAANSRKWKPATRDVFPGFTLALGGESPIAQGSGPVPAHWIPEDPFPVPVC